MLLKGGLKMNSCLQITQVTSLLCLPVYVATKRAAYKVIPRSRSEVTGATAQTPPPQFTRAIGAAAGSSSQWHSGWYARHVKRAAKMTNHSSNVPWAPHFGHS